MTDNKNIDEEYQYVEETGLEENPEFKEDQPESSSSTTTKNEYMSKINSLIHQPSIRRNGLIAIGVLFFLIFILKIVGKGNIDKKRENLPTIKAPVQIANNTNPMLQGSPAPVKSSFMEDNTTLNNLVESQRNMQSNLSAMRDQIGQLSNQLNTLSNTNQALIQQVAELAGKLMNSQQAIQELLAAKKTQPVIRRAHPSVAKTTPSQQVHYFVQAVIPGRAWLINTQGGTMTVRVGSKVPGLGVVHQIDALQGRVLMSSGRVIAFSQAD